MYTCMYLFTNLRSNPKPHSIAVSVLLLASIFHTFLVALRVKSVHVMKLIFVLLRTYVTRVKFTRIVCNNKQKCDLLLF